MNPMCPFCASFNTEATDIEHPMHERRVLWDVIVETWECSDCTEIWRRRYDLHHEEE